MAIQLVLPQRCKTGHRDIVGTLRNYDGDGNGNVQSPTGFISKTTTLHVHRAFLFISSPFLHNNDVKWPNFKLTWERERRGAKFTIFVWTRTRSPLISSDLTSLLSGNWLTWYKVEKVSEDVKSIFQRHFHWRRRCRVVRSLLVSPETGKLQCCVFLSIPREKWKKKKTRTQKFFPCYAPSSTQPRSQSSSAILGCDVTCQACREIRSTSAHSDSAKWLGDEAEFHPPPQQRRRKEWP